MVGNWRKGEPGPGPVLATTARARIGLGVPPLRTIRLTVVTPSFSVSVGASDVVVSSA
jgi:hypothetical protein